MPKRKRKRAPQPYTLGEWCDAINYDVRDLLRRGYSNQQINGIRRGRYSAQELLQRRPHHAWREQVRRWLVPFTRSS